MTSPLRYPGGKTRARKVLDAIMNEYFDVSAFETVISPFFGGGSFELYLQRKYGVYIVANDKFVPLAQFWTSCKLSKKRLCDELDRTKVTKEDFLRMQNTIMSETGVTQSVIYFAINRCSFSGATLSGGFSAEASKKRFTASSVNRIRELDLSRFEMHNTDFEDVMKARKCRSDRSLMFLDPPYYLESSRLYGKNGDMHESFPHEKLRECLSDQKSWFMTYNDCDYIRELYEGYTIISASWSYGMNDTKRSSEIVIVCE